METRQQVLNALCDVINGLKRTRLRPEDLQADLYLGGDLGIDSLQMLEVWYDLEKRLSVRIDDSAKRNVNTIDDALNVVSEILA